MSAYPKLRLVNARPQTENGYQYLVLEDPLALSARTLAVPQPWVALLHNLDGRHTIDDLYTRMQLHGMGPNQVDELLAALDESFLLDNARSENALKTMQQQYRNAPYRQMSCAGGVYPADKAELTAYFDSLVDAAKTPKSNTKQRGILSPHIDYGRGAAVYAEAWTHIAEQVADVDLVIIFGTDHVYGQQPFTLTAQNYATPYGTLPTDKALVAEVAAAMGIDDVFAGELFHRQEHSIELPLVWLHYLRQDNPPHVLPIMCSTLGSTVGLDYHRSLQALLETLKPQLQQRNVLVIASGDMAHVGPAFSTPPLYPPEKEGLRNADAELITQIEQGDALNFYRAIDNIDNCNNVCGWSPIYLMLALLDNPAGQVHAYDQCPADDENTSVVSICSATFA